jgi:hypothetical protein
MAEGILDISTLILLGRIDETTDTLPSEPLITTVILAELSVGPLIAADEDDRAARQAHLQQAEADFEPVPFDAAARSYRAPRSNDGIRRPGWLSPKPHRSARLVRQ